MSGQTVSSLGLAIFVLSAVQNGEASDACYHPAKIGPCKASFPRFFYNTSSCQCEQFRWGGCQPNENNFESLDECTNECGSLNDNTAKCGVRPPEYSDCILRPGKGLGGKIYRRWYYDVRTCRCKSFWYGGSGGNMNRFVSKTDCEASCGVLPCKLCLEPVKVGPCKGSRRRWYYHEESGRCKMFRWGGCQPNGNNFKNRKLCSKTCM